LKLLVGSRSSLSIGAGWMVVKESESQWGVCLSSWDCIQFSLN
jgi:hypothetical protein